ncbi:MAG: DEAD/DEAH box helicase [Chloroflexia bacterium]
MDARHAYARSGKTDTARLIAIERRRERAANEPFSIVAERPDEALGFYTVTGLSDIPYTVEIRDPDRFLNRCSCPDYTGNSLGTCKHIEAVLLELRRGPNRRKLRAARETLAMNRRLQVRVGLVYEAGAWRLAPVYDEALDLGLLRLVNYYLAPHLEEINSDPAAFAFRLKEFEEEATEYGGGITIDPDVWTHLAAVGQRQESALAREELLAEVQAGTRRLDLLREPLYPFQLLGVLFLAFTGRALLADDMGLGKTVQALGAAHLLMEQAGIKRVLIVTPASVKRQWAHEIERFSGLPAVVVGGSKARRAKQYAAPAVFTIINYELVLRDFGAIIALAPDLIVLDEAQRIKNWQAKTTRRIKELPAPYSFVLTGTPLENRLEELYSVVEFLDPRLLGPAWQFLAEHTVQDQFGAITGYKHLDEVRHTLAPIFLRRRKADVLTELPPRIDNLYSVNLTPEQARLYRPAEKELLELLREHEWDAEARGRVLSLITRLRELADAAQLVAPEVHASSKLQELAALVPDLVAAGHKMLVFSEWERMTRLAEGALAHVGVRSVRLHGGMSGPAREAVLREFREDPDLRVFISTEAGGLGLNLQAASYVINLDLPWNPARLEQRIARAHRMGQIQPVNVITLIAADTIEQRVLDVLYAKQALFTELFDTDIATINLDAAAQIDRFRELVGQLVRHEA